MIRGIIIVVLFLVFIVLLMTRKLQTIIALPLLAIAIAAVAGMPVFVTPDSESIVGTVIGEGVMRMSSAMASLIFGGIFGFVLKKTGITREIIRRAAELAGDRQLVLCLIFFVVGSVILSASGGVGMVILVGTIILPIMLQAGVSPFVAMLTLLTANGIGECFNPQQWGLFKDVLGLDVATISSWSALIGIPLIIVSVLMIIIFNKKSKAKTMAWAMPAGDQTENAGVENTKKVPVFALITPIIPIVLIFTLKLDIVPAVIIGIACALLLTWPKNGLNLLASAMIEGIQGVSGSLVLMIGIGMLLKSVMSASVAEAVAPIMTAITPRTQLAFILFFGILSPLAIYRGPLNIWGIGSGIAGLLVAFGMNPITAMIGLRACNGMLTYCDPTCSYHVWTSEFLSVDLNDYVKKTIPYVYATVVVICIIGSFFVF